MPSKSALKKSGWKTVQTKNKIKKQSRLALGILLLAGLILLISWTVRLTKNIFSPLKNNPEIIRNYKWDKEFNINLVIRTDKTALFSYNPKEGRIVIVNIPDETFLEIPYGFGNWQLRAVYKLGESQKNIGGDKLLVETLTNFLGVPIDGFLDFEDLPAQKDPAKMIEEARKNPFWGLDLLSKLKTNLTLWELVKLKSGIASVRFDKIKQINLEKILNPDNLADGTEILTVDTVKIDSILTDLRDPAIVSEHKSIAVYNATDHPQLAQKWARLITNLGGNVVITANAESRLQNTIVRGEESLTEKRMRQIFALGCQNNPNCGTIDPAMEDIVSSRTQINIFLGEDYFTK